MYALATESQPGIEEVAEVRTKLGQCEAQVESLQEEKNEAQDNVVVLGNDVQALLSFINKQCDDSYPTREQSFPTMEFDRELSQREIAETLVTVWLRSHTDERVVPDERLTDFRIEKIEVIDEGQTETEFMFHVFFSVKPLIVYLTDWAAGNGEWGEYGWIVDKSLYARVRKTNSRYSLRLMGTGGY